MRRCLSILLVLFVGSCRPAIKSSRPHPSPRRIVSLAPAITQKLYLLGVDERLVANTVYCKRPDDARHKAKIGNVTQVNVEMIVSLKPDLVIASSLTRPEQVQKLRGLGIHVVRCSNPSSFSAMCDEFVTLGKLVDEEGRAERIVARARDDVASIRKLTAGIPRKRMFVQIGAKPLFTVTKQSFVNDYIEFAGGENVVDQETSGICSREKVIKEDPEVILISTMGIVGEEEKKVWLNYPTISAVRSNSIHVLDAYDLCSPTPVVFVDTLKKIVKLLHPEGAIAGEPMPAAGNTPSSAPLSSTLKRES